MTSLLGLWSASIPTMPLMLAHALIINSASGIVLLLCVLALWCERERADLLPKPADFGGHDSHQEPLAA